jgi:mono/diheme cytochrome c family protein
VNYPIWLVPAPGLFIAAIAVLHVFISHFAIGGGLFLVVYETVARRRGDSSLLGYVRTHSRFFLLLTLVLGAVTGVGIWFTIGLVHPQATSTLIQLFVWVWAIEWTFFVTEIAAAMVYYYGWDRLSARTHLIVGWIYFVSAWMSLFVINGILTFMLTPGAWVETGSLSDAFFNPTFWPALFVRTLICFGLAGLYALLTASFLGDRRLKGVVVRISAWGWGLPALVLLVPALAWYAFEAGEAGLPLGEALGASQPGLGGILSAILLGAGASGYPPAQAAAFWGLAAGLALAVYLLLAGAFSSRLRAGVAVPAMLLGLAAFGGFEWIREDLRKPFVLGRVMFVNGVRVPIPEAPGRTSWQSDPWSLDSLARSGVTPAARWIASVPDPTPPDRRLAEGRQVFQLLCTSCHTEQGYLGIRPLVVNRPEDALRSLLEGLARPEGPTGEPATWWSPQLRVASWRDRRMPPIAGSEQEKEALAAYLSWLAGTHGVEASGEGDPVGRQVFEQRCIFCHGSESDWPMPQLASGRSRDQFLDVLDRLPEVNPIMPPFEGSGDEKEALARYLESLVAAIPQEKSR